MRYSELHTSGIKYIYGAFIIILVTWKPLVTIHFIFMKNRSVILLNFSFLFLNSKNYSFKIQSFKYLINERVEI